MSIEEIIAQFEKKLGNDDFFSPSQLVKAGVFGSKTSCRNALIKGTFPCLKISPGRTLIPRASIIAYLRNSFYAAKKDHRK